MYLFLINALTGGGAERVVQVLANHYVEQGTKVVVFTLEGGPTDFPFDAGVTHRQLVPLPNWKWLRNLVLPIQMLALCWWLWRLKPVFSFSLLVRSNFVNIVAGRFFSTVRCCISEHTQSTAAFAGGSLLTSLTIRLIRDLYPLADDIFCTCRGVRTCLEEIGVRHPRMFVVPNPIDLTGVGAVNYQPVPSRRLRIVTVGRLVTDKDHRTLLLAFAEVCKSMEVELAILGVGPLKEELQNLSAELGVADRVEFVGWAANVFEHLKQSDVFVLTSLYEGFGNVIVEAMACGLPVISTECDSGPAEILEYGKYGRLVPVGDVNLIGLALLDLLASPELRSHYSALSLARAEHFCVQRIGLVYERLLISGAGQEVTAEYSAPSMAFPTAGKERTGG